MSVLTQGLMKMTLVQCQVQPNLHMDRARRSAMPAMPREARRPHCGTVSCFAPIFKAFLSTCILC